MRRPRLIASTIAALFAAATLTAQQPQRQQASAQEMADAERDAPPLADLLELKPGMTVADVGAGFGAMSIVLSKRVGPTGRVIATDIAAAQLAVLRDAVAREHLTNMTVVEGAAASTNLPDACCDAIFMRDVYHHITAPEAFDRSLLAALKPGGRLAIIEFEPRKGSAIPEGVNPNRAGHGIPPPILQQELTAAGFAFDKTLSPWPPGSKVSYLELFRKP
jgi:ubiquinone/menaquinone biosynthesis C-methylase UbiE